MKRFLDLLVSICGLFFFFPIIIVFCILIWLQDFKNPFYIPLRVGLLGKQFRMFKLRSMVVNADKSGVDSTGNNDARITLIGKIIRRFKLDEITQLLNVFFGHMSLVGPRPNIKKETDLYTDTEQELLKIKPGITDFSSIVFSDEGSILEDKVDPDIAYHQLIRPWKSRLGLFYVQNNSFFMDIKLLLFTIYAVISRDAALRGVANLLEKYDAPEDLINVAKRKKELEPTPPPGSDFVVTSRETS